MIGQREVEKSGSYSGIDHKESRTDPSCAESWGYVTKEIDR